MDLKSKSKLFDKKFELKLESESQFCKRFQIKISLKMIFKKQNH